MKAVIFIFLTCCVGIFSLCYFAYKCGQTNKEKEIVNRSLQINKNCYTNTDLEIIIFNEPQL